MACTSSLKIPVDAKDQRIARLAQPRRILRHSIQNWLHIRRRAGDDAQDLTRRSLLLQRLLEFLEQSHVFDGNDGLIGEGFEQLNLRRSEGADLGPTCAEMSNGFPPLAKRHVQDTVPAAGKSHYHWKSVSLANVGNVQRALLTYPLEIWLINTDLNASNGYRTRMSPRSQNVSVAESQHHAINPTNPRCALDDGIEHRLHVRRRAANDAKHLGSCRLML